MYKFIVFSDLHLKDIESIGVVDNFGKNTRTNQKIKILYDLAKHAVSNKVDAVISAGDLYDNTYPSNRLKNAVSKIFAYLIKHDINVYVIGGNHDTRNSNYFNMMSECNFSDKLSFCKNKTIHTNEQINLKLLSWNQDVELKEVSGFDNTILIGHLQIVGAEINEEIISKESTPISFPARFKKAYLGHLHKRQQTKNYTYIGALTRKTFGERKNPTGFYLITIDGHDIFEEIIPVQDLIFKEYKTEVATEQDIYNYIDGLDIKDKAVKFTFIVPNDIFPHPRKIKHWAVSEKKPFNINIAYEKEGMVMDNSIKQNLTSTKAFNEFISLNSVSKARERLGRAILEKVEKEG